MRVIVAGSRTLHRYEETKRVIEVGRRALQLPPYIEIVSGTASGPDKHGERYSREELNREAILMPADWKKWGFRAGKIRNEEMARVSDALIAFWDGQSGGTADMIARMVSKGKPVYVHQKGNIVA